MYGYEQVYKYKFYKEKENIYIRNNFKYSMLKYTNWTVTFTDEGERNTSQEDDQGRGLVE